MLTSAKTKHRARALRKQLSPPELKLWLRLKTRLPGEPNFRRQEPIGPYVADFYSPAARLVIEVDGADHGSDEALAHDERRTRYLESLGLTVKRLAARWVLSDPDAIAYSVRALAKELAEGRGLQPPPPPAAVPLPRGAGEV